MPRLYVRVASLSEAEGVMRGSRSTTLFGCARGAGVAATSTQRDAGSRRLRAASEGILSFVSTCGACRGVACALILLRLVRTDVNGQQRNLPYVLSRPQRVYICQ